MCIIDDNDLLRREFKGGKLLLTSAVYDLEPQLRGRAIYRMTLAEKFTKDDHSEGVFVFGGYVFMWIIGTFAGERSITLGITDDWLGRC